MSEFDDRIVCTEVICPKELLLTKLDRCREESEHREEDRHLKEHRETACKLAVIFTLVKALYLFLLFLLGNSVVSTLVFCFNKCNFRCKTRRLYLVLLLFYREGDKENLKEQCVNN